jgi:glycosyltransferase involved in cell wall biosynthesis
MADKESIVFINQNAGYLMIDIVHAHTQYKHRTIISGKLVERNSTLDKSVKQEKIIVYNRSSSIKRLFTWSWGFLQILWLVKTTYRKSDLFIVTNPPFASLIPLLCKNKFSLLVYDVYPDALVAYKYIGAQSLITRLWKKANRIVFAKAQKIFTISNGMKNVLSQYVDESSIKSIPVWTDNDFLKPVPKAENIFISKYNLQHKFLVIYSGNLGLSHDIEVLVEIANEIKDDDIYFIIIGEGDKKKVINERIKRHQLKNCLLLPWQDVAMLPFSLSAADIAVVSLGKEASTLSVPSKTFNLLSVGAPLLCIADESSELAALVNRYQVGKCFNATDVEKIIAFIQMVKSKDDYRKSLQQNSLKASEQFGPGNALKFVLD